MSISQSLSKSVKKYLYKRHVKGVSKAFYSNKELSALVEKNAEFKDKHKNQRCFIVGNGPSLNDEDLSVLKNEIVFTVNKIAGHPQFPLLRSNYHFWADPAFFPEDPDSELIKRFTGVNTEGSRPVCFIPQYGLDFVKKNGIDKEIDYRFYYTDLCFRDGETKDVDFCKPVYAMETVVQFCIQMAVYMGFSEIYLLGCDTSYVKGIIESLLGQEITTYSYEVSKSENQFIKKMTEQRADGGVESPFLSCARALHLYRELYRYCSDRGIKLVNCSSKTIIDSLPRQSLTSVINGEKI